MRWQTILIWLAVGLAILLAVTMISSSGIGGTRLSGGESAQLGYLLVYGAVISVSAWAAFRRDGAKMLRYAVIWLAILGAIALLYWVTQR